MFDFEGKDKPMVTTTYSSTCKLSGEGVLMCRHSVNLLKGSQQNWYTAHASFSNLLQIKWNSIKLKSLKMITGQNINYTNQCVFE